MRSHRQIIADATVARVVAITQRPQQTVRSWERRDSIPSTEWARLIAAELAKPDELIAAAAKAA